MLQFSHEAAHFIITTHCVDPYILNEEATTAMHKITFGCIRIKSNMIHKTSPMIFVTINGLKGYINNSYCCFTRFR